MGSKAGAEQSRIWKMEKKKSKQDWLWWNKAFA
jgi:hypothetical protein